LRGKPKKNKKFDGKKRKEKKEIFQGFGSCKTMQNGAVGSVRLVGVARGTIGGG